ncbi:hypothetical protein H8356DRAFT_1329833 [Neocallimastix lanati (nom. inval.)]|nr:hypothetical protein H8356DRAFT_1329833 [Neocallimastix sp. JGI-2020a]
MSKSKFGIQFLFLFNFYFSDNKHDLKYGVNIGRKKGCGGLFADDVVLIASSVHTWVNLNEMTFGIEKWATMVIKPMNFQSPPKKKKNYSDSTFYLGMNTTPKSNVRSSTYSICYHNLDIVRNFNAHAPLLDCYLWIGTLMSIINLEDRRQNYHRIEHDITHSTYTDSFTTFSHIIVVDVELKYSKYRKPRLYELEESASSLTFLIFDCFMEEMITYLSDYDIYIVNYMRSQY